MSVVYSVEKGRKSKFHTAHLICTTGARAGRAIGCTRLLGAKRYSAIQERAEWEALRFECEKCTFCFKRHDAPRAWHAPLMQKAQTSGSESGDSDSESSQVPTDSEAAET